MSNVPVHFSKKWEKTVRYTHMVVAFWLLPLPLVMSATQPVPADDGIEKASASFQQAAYEFGSHLALGEPGAIQRQLQETWRQLTVLRNRACPPKLRRAVTEIGHNLQNPDTCNKLFGEIDSELMALAKKIDVTEARLHLNAAREALKSKQLEKVQSESLVVMDAVVAQLTDIPLVDWVEGLRRARLILGNNASRERMTQALNVLRGLKGVERFRNNAYHDSLTLADELIAAATDLYTEGDFHNAGEQLNRVERTLQLAARASQNEDTDQQLSTLWKGLRQANDLIVDDVNLARIERTQGFQLLQKARDTIATLRDKGVQ
jgi:hypothetical protein